MCYGSTFNVRDNRPPPHTSDPHPHNLEGMRGAFNVHWNWKGDWVDVMLRMSCIYHVDRNIQNLTLMPSEPPSEILSHWHHRLSRQQNPSPSFPFPSHPLSFPSFPPTFSDGDASPLAFTCAVMLQWHASHFLTAPINYCTNQSFLSFLDCINRPIALTPVRPVQDNLGNSVLTQYLSSDFAVIASRLYYIQFSNSD